MAASLLRTSTRRAKFPRLEHVGNDMGAAWGSSMGCDPGSTWRLQEPLLEEQPTLGHRLRQQIENM